MVWNEEKEVLLCREVIVHEPYKYKKSTKERGEAWSKIAEILNELDISPPYNIDQRAVREHLNALQKRYKKKFADDLKSSGTSPVVSELDVLMEELLNKIEEYEKNFVSSDVEKKEKGLKDEAAGKDIRKMCMETYAETSKRKRDQEEDMPRKSRRSTGSETIAYLKEKAEKDFTLKEQELELKKTEQEIRRKSADAQSNQFQCVMEQQRALFDSVQQQQAQQQQQNNLMMQMQTQTTQAILAMMDKIAKK